MSLEMEMMSLLESLPSEHFYRVTYDQGARHGRWRFIAIDKKTYRDVMGGAGASIKEARDSMLVNLRDLPSWTSHGTDTHQDTVPSVGVSDTHLDQESED